ncbi:DMAC2 protein, partial [Polypterus senegalus]
MPCTRGPQQNQDGRPLAVWRRHKPSSSSKRPGGLQPAGDCMGSTGIGRLAVTTGPYRFSGEREWFWENQLGKFRGDLSHFREIPVEEVDAKGTPITYDGLNNITILSSLRTLDLSNCPHVDDWCLSRLHALSESLEELSLSGCKKVSDKGLATLHHLKKLKKLELFDLSHISNPGLIRILLEEVLPECEILGIDYSDVLKGNSLEEINKQHS